jgi:hypothetical protein
MLRVPHFLDNRLTDSGKIISLMCQPAVYSQTYYFYGSGTHFCLKLSEPQGLVLLKGLGKLIKIINLTGS